MSPATPAPLSVDFESAALPADRKGIARLIVKSFADAGFGGSQQIAALTNAIAESALNPNAVSAASEQALGLFQLNRASGLVRGIR